MNSTIELNGIVFPETWQIRPIGELCEFIVDCLHETPEISEAPTGFYMARTSDIGGGRINFDTARHVTHEVYERRTQRGTPQEGDIFITREAPMGEIGRIPSNVCVCAGQRTIHYRPDPRAIDSLYLTYALLSDAVQYEFHANKGAGSVVDNLKMGVARSIPIPFPPLPIQREIAQILGSLDDKIDLNRRMNATLESMARALFKSWFVDFDPVRAKAEGRQPDGIDADTAALFPDSFQDSALGPIPAGWQVMPLDQIADFLNGLALQKFPPEGDEWLPVIKIRELRQGYIDESSNRANTRIKPDYIIKDGDVIFSWSGSLMLDVWCGGKGALNQHLFKVTSTEFPKWFFFHWVQHHLAQFVEIAANKATTMGHIQRHHLAEAFCVVPPDNLLLKMSEIIQPFFDAVIQNRLQSQTLATIRDALLPRLMSGEIEVL